MCAGGHQAPGQDQNIPKPYLIYFNITQTFVHIEILTILAPFLDIKHAQLQGFKCFKPLPALLVEVSEHYEPIPEIYSEDLAKAHGG